MNTFENLAMCGQLSGNIHMHRSKNDTRWEGKLKQNNYEEDSENN